MKIHWKDWDDIPNIHNSLLAILIETNERKILSIMKRKLKHFDEISVTKSGSQYLELRPIGSNKAIAV